MYYYTNASCEFLSTPSARRATKQQPVAIWSPTISIHALREEGDVFALYAIRFMIYFYPRPPRGGRHAASASDP